MELLVEVPGKPEEAPPLEVVEVDLGQHVGGGLEVATLAAQVELRQLGLQVVDRFPVSRGVLICSK